MSSIPDYTLVCGVDSHHLNQLATVFPTWARHKPSLLKVPMIVFFDREQLRLSTVKEAIPHPNLMCVRWPPDGVVYEGTNEDKWTNSHRYQMLAGFVHIPASLVQTPYFLKLDTDVVATGQDDWINPEWFEDKPAIVSHRWSFTKPPDQIIQLDKWASLYPQQLSAISAFPPLDLKPEKPDADRVGHARIISWCGFFEKEFTRSCAAMANTTVGLFKLPVPSQDGFMFYVAKRMNLGIVRTNMKGAGWQQWHTDYNIQKAVKEAML